MLRSENVQNKLLLFVACTVIFLLGFETAGFQFALLQASNEFRLEGFKMGLLVAAQYISISIMPLIFGRLSDRVGKKKVLTIFMIVFVIGCAIAGFQASAAKFIIGVLIIGAGYSVCECVATAMLADSFTKRAEKYINLSQSFFCLGAIVSPLILKLLKERFFVSWRAGFSICSIVMFALLPFALALPNRFAQATEAGLSSEKKAGKIMLLALVFCMFVYVGVETGLAFFADTIFTRVLNEPSMGAYAISIFWVAMGIVRFVFGIIKDVPRRATAASLFCLAFIMLTMIFCHNGIGMLCLYAASGFACGCVWPGITSMAAALYPESSGAAASYLMVGGGMGGAIMPMAIGGVLGVAGVFGAFIIMIIPTFLVGTFLWRGFHPE